MRTVLVAAAALLALAIVPAPAQAQQSANLVITLQAPEGPLTSDAPVVFTGIATYTADLTAVLGLTGIPITYTIGAQPEWTSVVVSPASDVFPVPPPGPGVSFTTSRMFTVTVTLADAPEADTSGIVEIVGTTGAAVGGRSATGAGQAIVFFDAPEEPCEDHAVTQAQVASWAAQAADAYNAHQASRADEGADEVSAQSTGASVLPLPWVALGGFALVGAGVGLLLRRRLR